jgi:hypothetical protein
LYGWQFQAGQAAEPKPVALIFRDIPSWDRNPDFEYVLSTLGLDYDVEPSSAISATDLSAYGFIIIPGAQWNVGYYSAFASNSATFEQYVADGGTLIVEMNGAEREGISLPGGVTMVRHAAVDNIVTIPNHPIVEPLRHLRSAPKITANCCASHGYLVDVPDDASVLAAEMATNGVSPDLAKPTFIEYAYGKGRVIGAAQCFHDQDGSGRGPLMETVLKYVNERVWYP